MSQPDLIHLPLSALGISRLNMRHGRKAPDVSDILPSIREKGIRQTLLVRREGDGYGIIAGRRRYFALRQIAAETGADPQVPCAVMPEEDAASAIEASLIENVARLPATEMEQYIAFRKLHDEGRTVEEIAGFFGVTELTVRRVLALAALSAPIRKLYAENVIDRETVRALTLATPAQQADWLRLWNSKTERAPLGRACRAWITGGSAITTDKALFDLAGYSGAVTADLFGEAAVFADAGAFWQAQDTAIAEKIEGYRQRGWAGVVVLERGTYFHRWEYEKRSKKQGGKVFVEQRHDGTVTFHEGWLKASEARRARASEAGGQTRPEAATRPEMSGPMADYVGLHRHAAAQASLTRNPAIALRLMTAHALCGSPLWTLRPHAPGAVKEATLESVEGGPAKAELDAARDRADALFEALGAPVPRRSGDAYHLCETFAALLAMPDTDVMQVMAAVMAGTLESGGPAVEAVLQVCGTDFAGYWKPDAAFLELLRDRKIINALLADIGSPALAERCSGDTRTTSPKGDQARIALAYCQSYEAGYYAAYRDMAEWAPDLVVHTGDYIYEGGVGKLGAYMRDVGGGERRLFETVRLHNGPEIVSLWDYRNRYALYKSDPDLQAAHAAAPWIVAMDDHEIDNNWAGDLPQDPEKQTELEFKVRKLAAFQAYYEHMPIEAPPAIRGLQAGLQMYGAWRLGPAQVHLLDTRQFRTNQPCGDGRKAYCEEALDPAQTMLGAAQEDWLLRSLRQSGAAYNLIATQVWFKPYRYNAPPEAPQVNTDSWDGYPLARQRLADALAQGIKNPVFLTGDWHTAMASTLYQTAFDTRSKRIGHELVGASISSGCPWARDMEIMRDANPHVSHLNGNKRGYLRVTVTKDNCSGDFRIVEDAGRANSPVTSELEIRTRDI